MMPPLDIEAMQSWMEHNSELMGAIIGLKTKITNLSGISPNTMKVSPMVARSIGNPILIAGMQVVIDTELPDDVIYLFSETENP